MGFALIEVLGPSALRPAKKAGWLLVEHLTGEQCFAWFAAAPVRGVASQLEGMQPLLDRSRGVGGDRLRHVAIVEADGSLTPVVDEVPAGAAVAAERLAGLVRIFWAYRERHVARALEVLDALPEGDLPADEAHEAMREVLGASALGVEELVERVCARVHVNAGYAALVELLDNAEDPDVVRAVMDRLSGPWRALAVQIQSEPGRSLVVADLIRRGEEHGTAESRTDRG